MIKGMESLNQLYRIGCGPSSSHTMGPEKACVIFKGRNPDADEFKAILYGSLAKTGKGHCTDSVIENTLAPVPCHVEFDFDKTDIEHPNTMDLFAYKKGEQIDFIRVFSVGGGRIEFEGSSSAKEPIVYNLSTFQEIKDYCKEKKYRLWQYVDEVEGEYIWEYLAEVWKTMKNAIETGIDDEGILPGGLEVQKKAKYLYNMEHIGESAETRENREVCSYAFAVSEQNASGHTIVTAPTCGAAGVLPAVLYYMQLKHGYTDRQILSVILLRQMHQFQVRNVVARLKSELLVLWRLLLLASFSVLKEVKLNMLQKLRSSIIWVLPVTQSVVLSRFLALNEMQLRQ